MTPSLSCSIHTCCFSTNLVSAGTSATFTPKLEAHGIIMASGCGTRSYTARNFQVDVKMACLRIHTGSGSSQQLVPRTMA